MVDFVLHPRSRAARREQPLAAPRPAIPAERPLTKARAATFITSRSYPKHDMNLGLTGGGRWQRL